MFIPKSELDTDAELEKEMRKYMIPIWGFPAETCTEEMLKNGIEKNFPGGLKQFENEKI